MSSSKITKDIALENKQNLLKQNEQKTEQKQNLQQQSEQLKMKYRKYNKK